MAAGNFYGGFSGRSAYRIRLYIGTHAVSGNSSQYYWELHAEKIASGTTYNANQLGWSVGMGGQGWNGTSTLDFRGTNSILCGTGFTGWYAHDGNGYLNFGFSAHHNGDNLFGTADLSGTFSADRIAQVPSAPTSVATSQVTATSIVYQFSGNADGGSAIIEWQAQRATNAAFTTGLLSQQANNGLPTFSGLTPGTQYWFRARGRNSVGWGPYSSALTATTLSGAFVGNASNPNYSGAAVYVGKDGGYVMAEVRVGKDGAFVIAS